MNIDMKSSYPVKKALVEHLWQKYQKKKDPRWLAEICLNVPFFDNPQVGTEIARRLEELFHKKDDIYEQTMRSEIWRLWKLWENTDEDVVIRQRIADIYFSGNESDAERVRGIIRAFEKLEK